jgi:hypothetical protein
LAYGRFIMDCIIPLGLYSTLRTKMNSNRVYFILIMLSVMAYVIGYLEFFNRLFVLILLISTFFKGKLVLDYFMELKTTSLIFRMLPSLWLFFVVTLIGVAYYF